MSYPAILLISAALVIVVNLLTLWRGVFVIGRWFGATNTRLDTITDKVDHQGKMLDEQSIQLARMDERLEALTDRMDRQDRGGL